jgi:integrase
MPTGTKNKRKPAGIRKTPAGNWQAFIKIRGKWRSRVFPAGTALTKMREWREAQRLGVTTPEAPAAGSTLADDVAAYLLQVADMPTLKWREADLILWLEALGPDRDRRTITAGEIRAQLVSWRLHGPRQRWDKKQNGFISEPGPLAANTVNHRRTALMHLWKTLDGRSAPNPVRDVERFRDDSQDAPPRSLTPAAVAAILEHMGESQTRARIEVMRWTGFPPVQLARIEPADLRWDDAVYVRPRRKGKGAAGAWLPVLPAGWEALRTFKRLGAWGTFSTSSARRSFRLAAAKAAKDPDLDPAIRAELADVTPYQLRHSFGTLIAGITRDDRAVQTLLQHADIRQTHRYTKATADPRAAAALATVAARLTVSTVQGPESPNNGRKDN